MTRTSLTLLCALSLCALSNATPATAQTGWTPDALVNLQLLPKDTSPARLMGMMRGFAGALGVTCQHCHVLTGSDPSSMAAYDFASDGRPEKATARRMMQAVQRINVEVLRDIGAPRPAGQLKVGCYTCHRGSRVPAVTPG